MSKDAALLLVEDNRDDVDVALRAFRRAGLETAVEVARDGQEALERLGLEEGAGEAGPRMRLRVVFLDLKMPRVDGFEVLRRLREAPHTRHLPVVVLSSSDRGEDIERSYALGANSVLVKHFDARSPGAYIVEAARYWLEANRVSPVVGGGAWRSGR